MYNGLETQYVLRLRARYGDMIQKLITWIPFISPAYLVITVYYITTQGFETWKILYETEQSWNFSKIVNIIWWNIDVIWNTSHNIITSYWVCEGNQHSITNELIYKNLPLLHKVYGYYLDICDCMIAKLDEIVRRL